MYAKETRKRQKVVEAENRRTS